MSTVRRRDHLKSRLRAMSMRSRSHLERFFCARTLQSDQAPTQHLILTPPEWRQVLRAELVASGFEQDAAGVIARSVVERLVRAYLTGEIERPAPATHQLDEAA